MLIHRRIARRLLAAPILAGALLVPALLSAQAAPRPGTLGPSRPAAPPPRQPTPTAPGAAAPLPVLRGDTTRPMALFGTVYDSLSQTPLRDATVQVVSETDRSQSFVGTTDSEGRYRITGVKPGRYLAGFYHEMLDAVGLEQPVMRVLIQPDTAARLDFGIPGQRTLRALVCNAPPGDTTGALVGVVRDAESGNAVPNAKVVVTWNELQITPAGLRNAHRRYPAKVRPSGGYVICGLPPDGSVEANAEAPGRPGGVIDVQVPPRGIVRRDFFLGDSTSVIAVQLPDTMAAIEKRPANPITVTRGNARLTGTVKGRDGRVLTGARLQVWGSGVQGRTTDNGAFSLGGLPAGTYSLEVRAIGYEPKRVAVDLSAKRPANVDVVLEKQVAVLAGVTVTGQRTKAETDYNGFLERKKNGFGRYFTQEDIENRNPMVMTDIMRMSPGMQVSPNGSFGYVLRGRGGCTPEIFLDGMRVMQGADDLDNIVRPTEVSGVEVYNNASSAPAQYGGSAGGDCGVVLIWTKRGGPNPRR
ncbi:TonB-dependent receptor plug [Gemmatirosa kalamazoonensis]|uniref:TonB-dependent receptor plug n=1 Tax=Gemmatirosa kalamazoonensis TaxID=861299 RepID=W0RI48_9BACT|nr:carboxypeptidase-like regulatory domain-containing protein [Gemmatirosa kalamazoonensis]AHG90456.1 TonB-dependent receptor plug [Gemmatirosa kalamazoonensis]